MLEIQIRFQSIAFIVAMTLGAAVYDPDLMQLAADLLDLHFVIYDLPVVIYLLFEISFAVVSPGNFP